MSSRNASPRSLAAASARKWDTRSASRTVPRPETAIKYMTDGMLMREYLMQPDLSRYCVLMLDEAHERTINTDVLFALLKKMCRVRTDLKLIITSATLDAEKFASYYFDCPIFTHPGAHVPGGGALREGTSAPLLCSHLLSFCLLALFFCLLIFSILFLFSVFFFSSFRRARPTTSRRRCSP